MTDIKDDLRQILYSPTLKRLSFSVLPIGASLHLPAGTLIAKQGDPPDGFYIILAGKTGGRAVGQQEAHAVTLVAGDIFAELFCCWMNRTRPQGVPDGCGAL